MYGLTPTNIDVLQSQVTDVAIDSPKSFTMRFANGLALRVVDSSEHYESFSPNSLVV